MRTSRIAALPALLLIAHGSRVAAANRPLLRLARQLRARFPGRVVEACYLEAASPDVSAGVERCVGRGASRILFVPYFLSMGGHVSRDLPAAAARARALHRGIRIRIAPHLGADPGIVTLVSRRVRRGLRASRWP